MRLAYTMTAGNGDLDLILAGLAQALLADGIRLAGVVQINTDREDCHACDMDVKVLPDGPVYRISQQLGKHARGCRLDASALETAVAEVTRGLSRDTDVLILNKFGKHEASGKGFRDLIAEAVGRDIPVIVGVNPMNKQALLEFSGDMAVYVEPDIEVMKTWLQQTAIPTLEPV